jgi:mycofactocin radical SAM maturase
MSVAVPLVEHFALGLDAPICLTWELTYACNLACRHCLSSSGRRDPGELSTAEAKAVIDELERMQVFYVNIGGGEPTIRPDFWELVDYATEHHVGVKFSTNGVRITPEVATRLAASDYVDVQISLDGATAEVNDAVRGEAPSPWRSGPWRTWRPPASKDSSCRWCAPGTTFPRSTPSRRSPTATARSCA